MLFVIIITSTFLSLIINNTVHKYYIRNDHNVHINNLSSLDRRNFIYHCILFWNNSPIEYRTLLKRHVFVRMKYCCI